MEGEKEENTCIKKMLPCRMRWRTEEERSKTFGKGIYHICRGRGKGKGGKYLDRENILYSEEKKNGEWIGGKYHGEERIIVARVDGRTMDMFNISYAMKVKNVNVSYTRHDILKRYLLSDVTIKWPWLQRWPLPPKRLFYLNFRYSGLHPYSFLPLRANMLTEFSEGEASEQNWTNLWTMWP